MKIKKITICLLSAALLLSATACAGDGADSADGEESLLRETFEKETYLATENGRVTVTDGLTRSDYGADSPEGVWLTGCAASDRDEQFDAYVLRHESTADGNTTFTYLVYYPHGGAPLAATPELLEGEDGFILNLRYVSGSGQENYSLCRLEVTLPTQRAPRLRLLAEEEPLGVLSTVTDTPIA